MIPINPREGEIEGLTTYASVIDVPRPIQIATVYVQPHIRPGVMTEIPTKGIEGVWLNPGGDETAVVARTRELGLHPILECSVVGIGESPASYL